ncbi:hypothetical protein [Zestomonas carbonaria]|uniref:Type IV pilus assembly protein PilV n=1 Tax=Zestomonas carbonaria TaxID=2762745 RepID=A0A7U7ENI7_9GAMM|nr:hypothetical protein [Pseudomonas carbonaria]CAD5108229.1 hypothetical protein PSEWESI4_02514 [Pseudomonas carbonaria]
MSRSRSTSRRQRGDALLEALIGILLMSIVGLGLVYTTSRVAVSQKDMNLQNLAVSQLRDLLQRNGSGSLDLCASAPNLLLPNQMVLPVTVAGCGSTLSASVTRTGEASPRQLTGLSGPLTLSVSDPALGGEIRVGGGL